MTCLHNHDQILEFLRKIFLKGFQIYQNYLCALTEKNSGAQCTFKPPPPKKKNVKESKKKPKKNKWVLNYPYRVQCTSLKVGFKLASESLFFPYLKNLEIEIHTSSGNPESEMQKEPQKPHKTLFTIFLWVQSITCCFIKLGFKCPPPPSPKQRLTPVPCCLQKFIHQSGVLGQLPTGQFPTG